MRIYGNKGYSGGAYMPYIVEGQIRRRGYGKGI